MVREKRVRANRTLTKVVGCLTMATALIVVAPNPASADLAICHNWGSGANGYLCFDDFDPNWGTRTWGGVTDNNAWWGAFGWNDRTDYHKNQGFHCDATVFQHINHGGNAHRLTRGSGFRWRRIVSSNWWC